MNLTGNTMLGLLRKIGLKKKAVKKAIYFICQMLSSDVKFSNRSKNMT